MVPEANRGQSLNPHSPISTGDPRFSIVPGRQEDLNLQITDLRLNDTGKYTCSVPGDMRRGRFKKEVYLLVSGNSRNERKKLQDTTARLVRRLAPAQKLKPLLPEYHQELLRSASA